MTISMDKIRQERRQKSRVFVFRNSWGSTYKPGAFHGWVFRGLTDDEAITLKRRLGDRFEASVYGDGVSRILKKRNSAGVLAKPSKKEVKIVIDFLNEIAPGDWSN